MKKRIRLTESDLHKIVKESVRRVLKEGSLLDPEDYKELDKKWANREYVDDSAYDDDDDTYGKAARRNYLKDWQ